MIKHLVPLFSLAVFFFASTCSGAFEGIQPASRCWDPKWKKDIDLSEFIPSSISTPLSGGSNNEGANGAAGNIGNSYIRSKLSFISDAKELDQAVTCIAELLDEIFGGKGESFLIDVTNESGYHLRFYGEDGLSELDPGQHAKYRVYNRYGAFFFKYQGKCHATRFQKGSNFFTNNNIYITNNTVLGYRFPNQRSDNGCDLFKIYGSFCNGPYNNDKELAFVEVFIGEEGHTKRCRSAGVF